MALPDEVYQAEGVLSVRLGVTLDEAERVLDDRATVGGITVTDAARHVLSDLARTAPTGPPDPGKVGSGALTRQRACRAGPR